MAMDVDVETDIFTSSEFRIYSCYGACCLASRSAFYCNDLFHSNSKLEKMNRYNLC